VELKKSLFLDYLLEANGLHDLQFDQWVFYPGMLLNSTHRWWGDGGERSRPHEGIDICFYRDRAGNLQRLGTSTRIPVMYAGEVVQIVDDYLGRSIFVGHELRDGDGNRLHTVYGHTDEQQSVRTGSVIGNREIIATVSDASKKNRAMPPHLHLTVAWIPPYHPAQLSWKTLQASGTILVDPLMLIECTYSLLPER